MAVIAVTSWLFRDALTSEATMLHRLLSLLVALQLALAPMAQATTPTAAYGGSFGDAFKGSFINSVVALGLADAQTGIGDVFAREGSGGEGSLGHVLLHGLAGCVAAEAQGADCAAGAAGGIAQAVYAGGLDSTTLTDEQQRQRAELIGAAAGWLFSGGEAQNVSAAASVALSGMINNRQLHANEKEILSDMLGRPIDDADFDTLDGVSDAERATLAAACALIKCSAHLSVNHPDYAARVALEREGWQNLTEMRRLMQAGNAYAGYDVQAEHGHLYLGGRGDRGDSGYEIGAFLYTGTDARYDWTLSAGHDIYGQKSSLPQAILDGLLGLASDPSQLWHGLVGEVQGTAEVWAAVFTNADITDAGEQLALKQALRGMDYADAATLAYLNGGLSNEEFRQALTDTAQAPAVLQTIVLGYAAGGYSLARGALVPRVAKPSFNGEIPESWVKLNPVGSQINTPKGFTTYRTPDGEMVHVSPAGLKYGSDPKFVNRVDHVLDNTAPNPDKPVHSVFNVQGDDALALVDEAWSRRTAPDPSDPYVYVVDLGRPIGTAGETKIRIVTMKPGGAEIRTAYPWQ